MAEGMKRNMMVGIAGLVIISLSSCNMNAKWEKKERAEINDYLASHPNLNYELKPSGLYYLDVVVGTGDYAAVHDTAHVMYNAYYLDGTKFDTNYGKTDTLVFPVAEGWKIPGVDEAITYMKAGGKSNVLVPSSLAYGSSGYNFPGYTPIVFDLYLVRLVKGPGGKK